MNERIKALRFLIDMAQEFHEDKVLEPLMEKAASIGVKHGKQAEWAAERQQEYINTVLEMVDEAETADAMEGERTKLALAVAAKANVEGMMVLTTAHVSIETMKRIADNVDLPIITKAWSDAGTVVYVPSDQDAWNNVAKDNSNLDVPDDIFACMAHARAHGCCWLLLDADGPASTELQFHDW